MYALPMVAAILPPGLLLIAICLCLGERGSRLALAGAFVVGGAMLLPVYGVLWLNEQFGLEMIADPYRAGLYRGFVLAAGPEELFRFVAVWLFVSRGKAPPSPTRALVYAVAVSLGFASLESFVYLQARGWEVLVSRTTTALFLHAGLGVILGEMVRQAMRAPRRARWWMLGRALLVTTALHGAYDVPLLIWKESNGAATTGETTMLVGASYAVFALVVALALWFLVRGRRAQLEALDDQ